MKFKCFVPFLPLVLFVFLCGSYIFFRWHSEVKVEKKQYSGIFLTITPGIGLSNGVTPPIGAQYQCVEIIGKQAQTLDFGNIYLGFLQLEHCFWLVKHHPAQRLQELTFPWALLATATAGMLSLILPLLFIFRKKLKKFR